VLPVELTVSTVVPAAARDALVAEAERIWRHENVHLRWNRRGIDALPAEASPLRVLVLPRPSPASDRWAVGELVPLTERRAIAIISIDGARRVIDEALRVRPAHTSGADYGLGLVLGRAVAHEIGHYLLATATHSRRGLMRAAFNSWEFADLQASATFLLDDDARHWMRHHVLSGVTRHDPAAIGPPPAGLREWLRPASGFSYAPLTKPRP
jgi:hypothetical protein